MSHLNTKTFILAGLIVISAAGIANAETDYRQVVRDTDGQIVRNTYENCVRTKELTDQGSCASQRVAQPPVQHVAEQVVKQRQETHPAAALTQEERTVYFKFDRTALLPESKDHLNTLAKVLQSDQSVKEARIVGYADRIGSVSYNQRLSQKRAETVRDYLIANGYTNARVTETRWVGKSEPSTNCPAEKRAQLIDCLHNDRRVEVEIGYVHEGQVSDAR